jgi:hypothetical protein
MGLIQQIRTSALAFKPTRAFQTAKFIGCRVCGRLCLCVRFHSSVCGEGDRCTNGMAVVVRRCVWSLFLSCLIQCKSFVQLLRSFRQHPSSAVHSPLLSLPPYTSR